MIRFFVKDPIVKIIGDLIMTNIMRALVLSAGVAAIGSMSLMIHDISAQTNTATVVKERQELMKAMGGTFGPIITFVKGENTDLVGATAAAQKMHDSMIKAVGLFPAGTAKGEAPESRSKPEVWSNAAEFKAAAGALIEASAKLAKAGNTGDADAFKAQVQAVGKACGSCHKGKKDDGGKFRFPKDG
jgi:cytochrome c556